MTLDDDANAVPMGDRHTDRLPDATIETFGGAGGHWPLRTLAPPSVGCAAKHLRYGVVARMQRTRLAALARFEPAMVGTANAVPMVDRHTDRLPDATIETFVGTGGVITGRLPGHRTRGYTRSTRSGQRDNDG